MSISSRIQSITENLEKDWDSIEAIGGEAENKNIENIASALDQIYEEMPKVEGTGTDVSLSSTRKGKIKIVLRPSELSQDEEPSPDNSQDVHVVSGDNEIKIQNKNLFDKSKVNTSYLSSDGTISSTSSSNLWRYSDYIEIKPNTSYITSGITSGITSSGSSPSRCYYDKNKNFISGEKHSNHNPIISVSPNNAYYMRESVNASDLETIKIEIGSTATSYVEHQEQTYPLSLGDLEYCKIGDYEDLFFKNVVGSEYYDSTLVENKWYLKKNIGKVVLKGDEVGWHTYQSPGINQIYIDNTTVLHNTEIALIKSNYFISNIIGQRSKVKNSVYTFNGGIAFNPIEITTIEDFKNWLSTHNTTVYYVLKTSTNILLNNTLQTQLDNLSKAISYQGQTNVSQTNNDLPFVLNLSALLEWNTNENEESDVYV